MGNASVSPYTKYAIWKQLFHANKSRHYDPKLYNKTLINEQSYSKHFSNILAGEHGSYSGVS